MDVFLAGIDHHLAPLDLRAGLAVPRDEVPAALGRLYDEGWAEEAMLVATCNRTELYVVSHRPDAAERCLAALRGLAGEAAPPVETGCYREREGETAALHLFHVAAGLESAILGETEIQGQVREAYDAAKAAGTAGRLLDRLARGALRTGRRARAETSIAEGGASHGSAAAEVVRRIFGTAKDRRILVVGAGQMAEQIARAIAAQGAARFVVANRTRERAARLAELLPQGQAAGLEDVEARLREVDVVVLAAGDEAVAPDHLRRALDRRRAPVLLVDVNVPRAVDPDLGTRPGVFLYDLEALAAIVDDTIAHRRAAIEAVEGIVAEEFAAVRAWHRTLPALPTIHSLHAWADEIRRAEVDHLPADAPAALREAVDRLTRRLVQKLLSRPAARVVKGMEEADPSMPTPEHLRSLFGLEEGDAP